MAKREMKGTTEEREKFMEGIFEAFYSKPENKESGKDLSVNTANAEFKKQYGTMVRNKKAYQIRDVVKQRHGLLKKGGSRKKAANNGNGGQPVTEAARPSQDAAQVAEAAIKRGAAVIEGTPEQLAWLSKQVLPQLAEAGLAGIKQDYATDKYAVFVRV